MKITLEHFRRLIREEYKSVVGVSGKDPKRFLHGEDPDDSEGAMVKSRLHSMKKMARELCEIIEENDQLPGWVQDHIAVAHENLQQVHGYLTGVDSHDEKADW